MTTEAPMAAEQFKAIFDKLEKSSLEMALEVEMACQIINRQTQMLQIALDQMGTLCEAEAIPLFFRKQILGALIKMKELHTDVS